MEVKVSRYFFEYWVPLRYFRFLTRGYGIPLILGRFGSSLFDLFISYVLDF